MDAIINDPFNTNKLYKLINFKIVRNYNEPKRDFKCVKTVE